MNLLELGWLDAVVGSRRPAAAEQASRVSCGLRTPSLQLQNMRIFKRPPVRLIHDIVVAGRIVLRTETKENVLAQAAHVRHQAGPGQPGSWPSWALAVCTKHCRLWRPGSVALCSALTRSYACASTKARLLFRAAGLQATPERRSAGEGVER